MQACCGIAVRTDGKGRWAPHIIKEHFWQPYKYDFFQLRECRNLEKALQGIASWLNYYNAQRAHERLDNESLSDYSRPLTVKMFFCVRQRTAAYNTAMFYC